MIIRPMEPRDLDAVRRVMSLAFGTFLGAPDPERFFGDLDFAGTRLGAPNVAAFVADDDGRIVGSNFATRWGSVAFFGPLSVDPAYWEKKLGQQLMAPIMDTFAAWKPTHRMLYTFPHSPKHASLYYRYGFHPRFLTAIMSKRTTPEMSRGAGMLWSGIDPSSRPRVLGQLREIAEANYPGLDLSDEIAVVSDRGYGDIVMAGSAERPTGFAICHTGPNTEAGSGRCCVKFGATRPGDAAAFGQLLEATEGFAAERGLKAIVAGVNTGREEAYRMFLERKYRTDMQGLTMHAPNAPSYSAPGHYVIDDWR